MNFSLFVYFRFEGKWELKGELNGLFGSRMPTLCLRFGILFVISARIVGRFFGFCFGLKLQVENALSLSSVVIEGSKLLTLFLKKPSLVVAFASCITVILLDLMILELANVVHVVLKLFTASISEILLLERWSSACGVFVAPVIWVVNWCLANLKFNCANSLPAVFLYGENGLTSSKSFSALVVFKWFYNFIDLWQKTPLSSDGYLDFGIFRILFYTPVLGKAVDL